MLMPPGPAEQELFLDELYAEDGETAEEIALGQLRAHLEAQGITDVSDEELEALRGQNQTQRTGNQEVPE